MTKNVKRHDAFAKKHLTNLDIAREFLTQYVPHDVLSLCDLSTITIEPCSYIEGDLSETFSDILYKINLVDSTEPLYLYTLVEVQSTPLKLMPLRFVNYTTKILERHVATYGEKEELPQVYCILFYNGTTSPYLHSCTTEGIFADKALYRKMPLGNFRLVDITVTHDDIIDKHKMLAPFEILQKHIRQRDINILAERFVRALDIADSNDMLKDLVNSMISYVFNGREAEDIELLIVTIEEKASLYKENIMSYAEKLRQEGMQQGMQEGMQQGMKQNMLHMIKNMFNLGIDIKQIAQCASMSEQEIKNLVSN